MNDDTSIKTWDYEQTDIELDWVYWQLVQGAIKDIDFLNESPLNKLAWSLFTSKYAIVED